MSTLKFCKDCRHFNFEGWCTRGVYPTDIDLIFGTRNTKNRLGLIESLASVQREKSLRILGITLMDRCGPEAKFFQPKEETT